MKRRLLLTHTLKNLQSTEFTVLQKISLIDLQIRIIFTTVTSFLVRKQSHMETIKVRVFTILTVAQMMFSSKAAIMSDCLFISIWFCWKEMGISFQPLTVHNYVKYWPSKFALITWASLLLLSCSLFRCLSRSNRACSAGLGIAATGLVVGGVTVWGGAGAGLGCLGATGAAGAVFSTGAGLLNNYLDPWQWQWHV